jgi:NAD(P)-dependent dehydrogenase (short-subunit alcohol dehydrogenase family)
MSEFEGKTLVVTGAAGNLGRAVAEAFAASGVQLVLIDRNPAYLEEAAAAIGAPRAPLLITTDLTDPASVNAMAERVASEYGGADLLANIAGGFSMGPPLHETGDDVWDHMMDLNVRSVFHTCRALVPQMLARGAGRIVNVSARAAREGKARMGPYCASKAAVITLTETLAAEHKHRGINVNCILPGTVDTPQNRAAMPDAAHDTWVPPAALADVVLFLCSGAARCVTGAAIPVYGKS